MPFDPTTMMTPTEAYAGQPPPSSLSPQAINLLLRLQQTAGGVQPPLPAAPPLPTSAAVPQTAGSAAPPPQASQPVPSAPPPGYLAQPLPTPQPPNLSPPPPRNTNFSFGADDRISVAPGFSQALRPSSQQAQVGPGGLVSPGASGVLPGGASVGPAVTIPGLASTYRAQMGMPEPTQIVSDQVANGIQRLASMVGWEQAVPAYLQLQNNTNQGDVGRGRLGLDTAIHFGAGGIPGTLQTAANDVQGRGHVEQQKADDAARQMLGPTLARLRQQNQNWSSSQLYEAAFRETGIPVDRIQRLYSAVPVTPSTIQQPVNPATTASHPPVTPTVDRFGLSTETPAGITARPWSGIENVLDSARLIPPPQGQTAGGGVRNIGQFLLHLNNSNPGMIQQNLPAVMAYIRDRYGPSEAESAFRAASNARQLDPGGGGPLSQLLRAPLNILNMGRQLVAGPTENEQGLSMLGNLLGGGR